MIMVIGPLKKKADAKAERRRRTVDDVGGGVDTQAPPTEAPSSEPTAEA